MHVHLPFISIRYQFIIISTILQVPRLTTHKQFFYRRMTLCCGTEVKSIDVSVRRKRLDRPSNDMGGRRNVQRKVNINLLRPQ